MDVDDFLSSTDLPDVSVNPDEALERTTRRDRTRRQRRAAAGVASVLLVVGLLAVTLNVARPDGGDRSRPAALSTAPADPHECEAKEGSVIDVAHEPNWRSNASYLPWTDADGCLLRIDVLAERPGPEHCGWQQARVLIVGQPLGTPYTTRADTTEFVRDPDGAFDRPDLTAGFDPLATLPDDAVDSGFRRDDLAVFHTPGDQSAIWLVSPEGVERWPAGDPPLCL